MSSPPSVLPATSVEFDVARFRQALLAWYRQAQRPLPWRQDGDPYRVWISEIMLQQTTVQTVLPYYERFLAAFPTVAALAAAPLDDVLARWSGLGYYSRARNLHAAARAIVSEHGGRFPREHAAALALPGIGRYTAAAILSIAWDAPHAVLDGNVIRVITRLDALRGDPKSSALQKRLWQRAGELLEETAPGAFNQAMMELGATICTPRAPRCAECPVAAHCQARREGLQDVLPEAAPRPTPVAEQRAVFLIRSGRRMLFRQRPADAGLMPGLWELPDLALAAGETGLLVDRVVLGQRLAREIDTAVRAGERLGEVRHSIMNRRIRLEVFAAELSGDYRPASPWRWLTRDEVSAVGTSSIVRKVLRLLGDHDDSES